MIRKIARVLVPIAIIVGAYHVFQLSVFHYWAASVPGDRVGWHGKWGNIFLAAAILMIGLAGCSIYWLRRKNNQVER